MSQDIIHTTSTSCLVQAGELARALQVPFCVWLASEDPTCWRYRIASLRLKVEDPSWQALAIVHPDGTLVPTMTEDEKERMASVQ